MVRKPANLPRRQFLKTALSASAAAVMAPTIIPSSALGRDGAVAPSERIVVGGIGIGNRGTYDLGCFLEQKDVQFVAVCDVKEARRDAVKKMADEQYGNQDCGMYRDFRELLDRSDIDAVLIATGPNWHATAAMYAAKAGKDMYCEKPCTKNIAQSLILADTMRRTGRVFQAGTQRRNLPHFAFACELARTGKLGKLKTVYAHPAGMKAADERLAARRSRSRTKEVVDWDMYLGPAAWRPFNAKLLDGFNFEKGGGLVGGGVLEWGSHCVDLCQWAVGDSRSPVEYNPPKDGQHRRPLRRRRRAGLPRDRLDSARLVPGAVRGRDRLGRSGRQRQDGAQLAGVARRAERSRRSAAIPATFHVRDFLDCVKTRSQPKGNADAACNAHIACHAANIAICLGPHRSSYDPKKNEFIGDEQANRLRSEALREPWRL